MAGAEREQILASFHGTLFPPLFLRTTDEIQREERNENQLADNLEHVFSR
jgi:hypothetical protein